MTESPKPPDDDDEVDEASEESFPASDPPAFSAPSTLRLRNGWRPQDRSRSRAGPRD